MRNSKVLSGLMGVCVGDALGVPVEFTSRRVLPWFPGSAGEPAIEAEPLVGNGAISELKQTNNKCKPHFFQKGMSLSENILKIATDFVGKDLVPTEYMTLSEKDWEIVTSAIKDPPELNSALKTAINRYKKEKL